MARFYTGNTGRSTGPHLDFRVWDIGRGGYVDPMPHIGRLTVNGNPLADNHRMSDPYGADRGSYIHQGVDYATELNTGIDFDGQYIGTVDDQSGGGISSQYRFRGADGKLYDGLLMHGSDQNTITLDAFDQTNTFTDSPTSTTVPTVGDTTERSDAKQRAQNYAQMSKAEMNAAYDEMRSSDPNKAKVEGMKMHNAFFGKS